MYLPIVNVVFRNVSSTKTSNLSSSLFSYSVEAMKKKKKRLFGHSGLTSLIYYNARQIFEELLNVCCCFFSLVCY